MVRYVGTFELIWSKIPRPMSRPSSAVFGKRKYCQNLIVFFVRCPFTKHFKQDKLEKVMFKKRQKEEKAPSKFTCHLYA